ncbi:carboxypeptidase-like regulatory domain-containing protein [Flammeovirgaceae bacterium SG7u.111]|nr:carboxypeptidase-like regulatory domain-containing protein [Flammeovirgaceae bacterium SG7u.132]WPO37944.1 carboxypeptidase-like regulatory domain-containing protein [Flammeovirgaceae bacterium SG7u.111]
MKKNLRISGIKKLGVSLLFLSLFFTALAQKPGIPRDKVSFKFQNSTLIEAMGYLEEIYGLEFAYFNTKGLDQKISVQIKDLSLAAAIQKVFEKTLFSVSEVGGKWVLQTKKHQLFLKGQILDSETQSPLAFATVSIKGQKQGSASNVYGNYLFNEPNVSLDDTLSVSMLGYTSRDIPVYNILRHTSFDIALESVSKMLEEVWVTDRKNVYLLKRGEAYRQKTSSSVIYGKYVTKARLDLPIDSLEELDIQCGAGKMEMLQHDKDMITIEADIITTSIGEKVNKEFVDRFLNLFIEEQGNTAYLKSYFTLMNEKDKPALTKFLSTPGSKINLKVYVPANLDISINDGSGDVFLKNLSNNIRMDDGSGDISVENLIGNLSIRDHSGMIEVKHVVGNVKIKDDSGDVLVSDLNGSLEIKDGSGNIGIEEVVSANGTADNVQVYDRSGHIELNKMNSDVKLKDRSGKIQVKNLNGNLEIKDRSGSIYTNQQQGKASIKDRSGRIYINKEKQ